MALPFCVLSRGLDGEPSPPARRTKNAKQNSDKQNARIEHDKALARVMTAVLKDDTSCSSSSRALLSDSRLKPLSPPDSADATGGRARTVPDADETARRPSRRPTRRMTLADARQGIVLLMILGPCWAHSPDPDHRL